MLLKVEWKSVTVTSGAQCVMTRGGLQMHRWPADNLDSLQQVCTDIEHCIYLIFICFFFVLFCFLCACTFPHLY